MAGTTGGPGTRGVGIAAAVVVAVGIVAAIVLTRAGGDKPVATIDAPAQHVVTPPPAALTRPDGRRSRRRPTRHRGRRWSRRPTLRRRW